RMRSDHLRVTPGELDIRLASPYKTVPRSGHAANVPPPASVPHRAPPRLGGPGPRPHAQHAPHHAHRRGAPGGTDGPRLRTPRVPLTRIRRPRETRRTARLEPAAAHRPPR